MKIMFQQIVEFFKQQEWQFTTIEDKAIALLGISGKNGKFQCVADVREDEKKFIFLSICGANVPENKRIQVNELLTRLNFGIFLGNFEMDFEDGEIRFKTSIYFGDSELSSEIIENLILSNISTMDLYLDAIMKLIYGNHTALEIYERIESEQID